MEDEKMVKQVREIKQDDKLMTIKDFYIDGELIPAGTFFYVCSYDPYIHPTPQKVRIFVCSGYGANLTMGIMVKSRQRINFQSSQETPRILPLDCLQLIQKEEK